MRKTAWMFTATLAGSLWAVAAPTRADEGEGLVASLDQATWSQWQGRISYGLKAPLWRSGLGGFESGGLNVNRSGNVDSVSLMGDYYFTHSLASAAEGGGFRATSGLIVGRRSQLAVAQPGLAAGGLLSVGGRLFDTPYLAASGDAANDTAALTYLGLGYTGLAARGSLSFSADLGMVGHSGSDASTRPFGAGQRVMQEVGRDQRMMPMVQLGVLYSF